MTLQGPQGHLGTLSLTPASLSAKVQAQTRAQAHSLIPVVAGVPAWHTWGSGWGQNPSPLSPTEMFHQIQQNEGPVADTREAAAE